MYVDVPIAAADVRGEIARYAGGRRPGQLTGGRHGLSREQVASSQRGRIVRAMVEAAGQHGYQATRVQDIIARAGVSRRTFYELFHSKEDCFITVYEQSLDRLFELTMHAFRAHGEWVYRLRAALIALLGALAYEPAVARICFVEVMAAGPKALERRNEAMRRFTALFEPGEQHSGPVASLFPSMTVGRVGDLSEILQREIAAGRCSDLPRLVPGLMYAMAVPFLGAEAARKELRRAEPLLR